MSSVDMKNFWITLQKPIMVMAPMADVTDAPFRKLFAKYGKPDVTWTEFVSCDGLQHTREIQGLSDEDNPLMKDLIYSDDERPIVAQLFTGKPENMEYGAKLVEELGFDGIDINMGCPDRTINKQEAGADLIRDPKRAQEIVYAAKQGAPNIPVSVKTRVGYNEVELDTWVPNLLETKPAVLTMHARTRKELSKVPARWEHVKQTVAIRDSLASETLIFGNGDVNTLKEAHARVEETGCDGVMVGRGIFGNPWFFNPDIDRDTDISIEDRLKVMIEHTKLFEEFLPHKNFHVMKKHYKAYVHGWNGAKELRMKLMETNSAVEVEHVVDNYLKV